MIGIYIVTVIIGLVVAHIAGWTGVALVCLGVGLGSIAMDRADRANRVVPVVARVERSDTV